VETEGYISSIETTVKVSYGSSLFQRRIALFDRQIEIRGDKATPYFSGIGDSGSLLVENQSTRRAVGLLFAGTQKGISFANPINEVLSALLVNIL
jgi:hypothetical protein